VVHRASVSEGAATRLRDWTFGSRPPLGLLQYRSGSELEQACLRGARRWRWRSCLLKACARRFRPPRPQSRYCSAACRGAAQRWRRRQASRRWRASHAGQDRRRAQCRRYRQRIPLRVLAEPAAVLASPVSVSLATPPVPVAPSAVAACEGQRPAEIPEGFWAQPCQRPGCYEVFAVRPHTCWQRFCCGECRRALRRVLEREARYRQRRRLSQRARRQRRRAARDAPS